MSVTDVSIDYGYSDVDGLESLRHRIAPEESVLNESKSQFAEDIYTAAVAGMGHLFGNGASLLDPESRKRDFVDRLLRSGTIGDANHNDYLDVEMTAVYDLILGGISVFSADSGDSYSEERFYNDILEGQTAGMALVTGRLDRDKWDPSSQLAESEKKRIRKYMERNAPSVAADPYNLMVVGKYLDRRLGGSLVLQTESGSNPDMKELRQFLQDYLSLYYVNTGVELSSTVKITPFSKLTDFVVDPDRKGERGRAVVNCSALADISAALLTLIHGEYPKDKKFDIHQVFVTGAGGNGHALTVAEYKNKESEEGTLIICDNELVSLYRMKEGETLELAANRYVMSMWAPNYNSESPVNIETTKNEMDKYSLSDVDFQVDLPEAVKKEKLVIPLEGADRELELDLPEGLEAVRGRIVIGGKSCETYLRRISGEGIFYAVIPPAGSRMETVFGLSDPWDVQRSYNFHFDSSRRIPLQRMQRIIEEIEGIETGIYSGRDPIIMSAVLEETRDAAFVNQLRDRLLMAMRKVGHLSYSIGLWEYFSNPNISEEDMEFTLKAYLDVPHQVHDWVPIGRELRSLNIACRLGMEWTSSGVASSSGSEVENRKWGLGVYFLSQATFYLAKAVEDAAKKGSSAAEERGLLDETLNRLMDILFRSTDLWTSQVILREVVFLNGLDRESSQIISSKFAGALRLHHGTPPVVEYILKKKADELSEEESATLRSYLYSVMEYALYDDYMRSEAEKIMDIHLPFILKTCLCYGAVSLNWDDERDKFILYHLSYKRIAASLTKEDRKICLAFFAQALFKSMRFVVHSDKGIERAKFFEDVIGEITAEITAEFGRDNATGEKLLMGLKWIQYLYKPLTLEIYNREFRGRMDKIIHDEEIPVDERMEILALSSSLSWEGPAVDAFLAEIADLSRPLDFKYGSSLADIVSGFVPHGASGDAIIAALKKYCDTFEGEEKKKIQKYYLSEFRRAEMWWHTLGLENGFGLTDRIISEIIYAEPKDKHRGGIPLQGLISDYPDEVVRPRTNGIGLTIEIMLARCSGDNATQNLDCRDHGAALAREFKRVLEGVAGFNASGDVVRARSYIEDAIEILDSIQWREAFYENLSMDDLSDAAALVKRLLRSNQRAVRDGALQLVSRLSKFSSVAHGRPLSDLDAAAERVRRDAGLPEEAGISLNEAKELALEDADPKKSKRAMDMLPLFVLSRKAKEELAGKTLPPQEMLQKIYHILKEGKRDMLSSISGAASRSEVAIEQGLQQLPRVAVPVQDGVENADRGFEFVFDGTRSAGMISVSMVEGRGRHAEDAARKLKTFQDSYPYRNDAYPFFMFYYVDSIEGGASAQVEYIYPDPRDTGSAAYAVMVTPLATQEEIRSLMAVPLFDRAPSSLKMLFETVCSESRESAKHGEGSKCEDSAKEEFKRLWTMWHSSSGLILKEAMDSFQKGDKLLLERLLIFIQILVSGEPDLYMFNDFTASRAPLKVVTMPSDPPTIESISGGNDSYSFRYSGNGRLQ